MRKLFLCVVCLTLLTITPALAEVYSFSDVHAMVEIPKDYEIVLTPYNLSSSTNASWMAAQGMDYDATLNQFETEGILLQAFDAENDRTFVLTALKDLDGQTYFDLNKQDEAMRKEFRTNHTNGIGYSTLGYSYSSAKWTTYKGTTLRFLHTKYTLRQEGQQVCTGYQRRTIRNGYTITLDMQVRGRAAKDADDKALEKIMKTFGFSEILPMPEVPVKLALTDAPPTETNDATFTIKGTTGKNAALTATVLSLGSAGGSKTFTATANKSGKFTLKVTLPAQGVYSVTLTSEADGAKPATRIYSVTYRQGMLPVDVSQAPDSTLNDSTVISGSTISGAKTQLSVSGPITYNKTTTSRNFKFTVDTSKEGTYNFVLAVTKKGMEARTFTYTCTRSYTDAERESKVRSTAKKVTYAQLSRNMENGKLVTFVGYISSLNPSINEWVITVATAKSGSTYKSFVYAISTTEPKLAVNDKVRIYGTYSGSYSVIDANGAVKTYPRVDVSYIQPE